MKHSCKVSQRDLASRQYSGLASQPECLVLVANKAGWDKVT